MKNNVKKITLAVLLATTGLTSTLAMADTSANASVTSNYLWRGMEQTDGGPAVQGGVDWSNADGFYAGAWASNVSWADTSVELDLYGGYSGSINESVSFDVGYIWFAYPGTDTDLDFSEVYANFTMDALTVGVAVLATADGADFGDSLYISADYAVPLANDFELGLHVGSYTGDFVGTDLMDIGVTVGKDSWSVGLSKLNEGDDELKIYASYAWDFAL